MTIQKMSNTIKIKTSSSTFTWLNVDEFLFHQRWYEMKAKQVEASIREEGLFPKTFALIDGMREIIKNKKK